MSNSRDFWEYSCLLERARRALSDGDEAGAMLWRSVLSQQAHLEACVRECLELTRDFPRPIDLALVFVHSSLRQDAEPICQRLRRELGVRTLLGCTGGGVVGDALEVEHSAALSVTVAQLPGVELQGFYLEDDDLPSPDAAPEAWAEALGIQDFESPAFLLLGDAFEFETEGLLRGLDYAYPGAVKLGALASDARQPGGNRLLLNHQSFSRGLVGLALAGNVRVDAVVAQGCRPIGRPMIVTGAERNHILELDGQAPLEKLEEILRQLDQRDRTLAESSLFLGIRRPSGVSLQDILSNQAPLEGDFLIRNLIGLEPRRGSLLVGASMRAGQSVQFHLRDARASGEDLTRALNRFQEQGSAPAGALLFTCLGRGEYLYRQPNHDSHEFRRHFPGVPLGGFFGNGEIGPVSGTSYLHGYTSCFAMFSPRQA